MKTARSIPDEAVETCGSADAGASSTRVRRRGGWAGFTLIELLVVIAVIGILASIAIPQFDSYRRKGFDADVQANVRNMAISQEAYFVDNNTYTKNVPDLKGFGYVQSSNVTPKIETGNATTFVVEASVTNGCKKDTGVATYDQATSRITLVKCAP